MAKLLWEWKPRFVVALVVRDLLIVTSHTDCDVTSGPVVMRRYANADGDEQRYKTSKTQVSLSVGWGVVGVGVGGGCVWSGGERPWPSRSNLTSNSKLTPFWACPNHYSRTIQVRISKFRPQMHFGTVKIPINLGLGWPWTSLSFLIPELICLHCGGVHWDCETVPCSFQCCSGTISQSLHQCTWRTQSQSGMGPLLLWCLIWIK